MIDIFVSTLELGCIYALVVLALYIVSVLINVYDFSIEGSFASGGAITAVLSSHGINASWALVLGMCVGGMIGSVTGFIHTRLHIDGMLSGIIVTTALFSLQLAFVGPHAIIENTIFDIVPGAQSFPLLLLAPCAVSMLALCAWFLRTEMGFCLRAAGVNSPFITSLGKSAPGYVVFGLIIANALAGFAGALFVQQSSFFSVTGSIGTLMLALAGLLIGQAMFGLRLIGTLVGAIAYQSIIAVVILLQVDPVWTKLITAGLIVGIVWLNRVFSTEKNKGEFV